MLLESLNIPLTLKSSQQTDKFIENINQFIQ